MKLCDKRNMVQLLEVLPYDEPFTARLALDMLVEYKIQNKQSIKYVPHVNRLSSLLSMNEHLRVYKTNDPKMWIRRENELKSI